MVQVADGCARVRAYDGMRGKLGLGAVQRGIADSARELRVIDPSATLYSTASTLSPPRTTRTTEERGAARTRLTPAAPMDPPRRGGDRNFSSTQNTQRILIVNGRERVESLFERLEEDCER